MFLVLVQQQDASQDSRLTTRHSRVRFQRNHELPALSRDRLQSALQSLEVWSCTCGFGKGW
ncbi:hypothetical protein D9M68_618070 [compost metagenome]